MRATYALQLTDDPTYEAVRRAFGQFIFAGAEFMGWRPKLSGRHRTVCASDERCTRLLFLEGCQLEAHRGLLTTEHRIVSKWGEMPRYRHGLAEVPAAYGENVKFFQRPSIAVNSKGRFS